jgi:hypothetical protein
VKFRSSAWDHRLCRRVLAVFLRVLLSFERRRARRLGHEDPEGGAVTAIQRFGSALNLNVHFHCLPWNACSPGTALRRAARGQCNRRAAPVGEAPASGPRAPRPCTPSALNPCGPSRRPRLCSRVASGAAEDPAGCPNPRAGPEPGIEGAESVGVGAFMQNGLLHRLSALCLYDGTGMRVAQMEVDRAGDTCGVRD